MKNNWLIPLVLLAAAFMALRWQGQHLVTPVSPNGILDLEFARTPERLRELKMFWNPSHLAVNIYIDFAFIVFYTWFLYAASTATGKVLGWTRMTRYATTIAILTGLLDTLENFLMIMVFNERFVSSLLHLVYFTALLKFLLAGILVAYLFFALPFVLMKKRRKA